MLCGSSSTTVLVTVHNSNPSLRTSEDSAVVRSGINSYRSPVLTWFIGSVEAEQRSAVEDHEEAVAYKVEVIIWFVPKPLGWFRLLSIGSAPEKGR